MMNRKTKVLFSLLPVLVASSLGIGGSNVRAEQSNHIPITVETSVIEEITTNGEAEFLVSFDQTADLSAAEGMDWVSRGDFVYQTLLAQAQESQGRAIAYMVERGIEYHSFFTTNSLYVYEGDLAVVRMLASLPGVSRIYTPRVASVVGTGNEDPVIPRTPLELLVAGDRAEAREGSPEEMSWAVQDTQADDFWTAFSAAGEGIIVASIDTGVQWDHPALIESYKCQANPSDPACWLDPGGVCPTGPCDTQGHGTGTMGPITGENEISVPYQVGMAPEAQWITCLACPDGGCSEFNLYACADWVVAPGGDPANRPHLVNNGWGWVESCSSFFMDAINAWLAAGIAATFANGGDGSGCGDLYSPGDHFEVFSPTAHDLNRELFPFSHVGPSSCPGGDTTVKPNISAPGVDIWLPFPTNEWIQVSGTSYSNSYGSGALVLLMSCSPELVGNPPALFEALQDAADLPPDGYCGAPPSGDGNFTYGHGYINVLAAGMLHCGATGWLEGEVTDQDSGNLLAGAVITATMVSDPANWKMTTSDGSGYYSFTLNIGIYDLLATYPEYLPGTATVEVLTDTVTIHDFVLEWNETWVTALPIVVKN